MHKWQWPYTNWTLQLRLDVPMMMWIEEYNKLGTLVNHCREYSYVGRFSFYMAVFLLIFASLEPLSDRNFMYTIHTYGFYVYYVASLAFLLVDLVSVIVLFAESQ